MLCFRPHLFQCFYKAGSPSETATLGSAILFISALHVPACSYLHRYHPSTCFSLQQISIHAFRPRYMPSKNNTSLEHSSLGGIAHISQNLAVFLLKLRPPPNIVDCASLPNSQSKKLFNSFELLSIGCVKVVLHTLQSQRWEPALVFPDFTLFFPQTGQFT